MARALMASALMARKPYGHRSVAISLYGQAFMARGPYGQCPYGKCPYGQEALWQ